MTLAQSKTLIDLSPCTQYAYRFHRCWDADLPVLGFIVLHAGMGAWTHDRMIGLCISRAKQLNFGAVEIAYLFPVRLIDASQLATIQDPVGNKNKADGAIMDLFARSFRVVAAWGDHVCAPDRADEVLRIIKLIGHRNSLWHSGLNRDGSPKNPSQVSMKARLHRWAL